MGDGHGRADTDRRPLPGRCPTGTAGASSSRVAPPAGALVAGALGRTLLEGRATGPTVDDALPPVTAGGSPRPEPSLPAASQLDVAGITPIVVPNDQFYRIDTALLVPRVDASTWSLTVKGMVDREVRLTYEDLRAMPLFDQYVTIACVSNEVGGKLRRQRAVDRRPSARGARHGGRPGRSHPDRGPLRGRLHGRLPDRVGDGPRARPDDRPGHERRAAARRPRLPGAPHHPGPVRLRQRDQVAGSRSSSRRGRASTPTGCRSAGPRRGRSSPSHASTCRATGTQVAAGPVNIAGVAWAPGPGRRARRGRGRRRGLGAGHLSAPLSDATWVQWLRGLGRDGRPAQPSWCGRRMAPATSRPRTITSPAPDGARGHHTIEVEVAEA